MNDQRTDGTEFTLKLFVIRLVSMLDAEINASLTPSKLNCNADETAE